MANNWQTYKLSEICEIISGGTPKTSIAEYWNGNIFWLSVKDFNTDSKYVYKSEKTITELGLKNSSTNILQKGDIIISARGTVGELAMIPYDMAFNQSCYGLRAKEMIESNFLYYLLKNNINILKNNTHGSVFDTITRNTFDDIEISLPLLGEQNKIARVLSALDDKIELNNKINQNLDLQAQSLFNKIYNSSENGVLSDIVDIVESGNRPKGGACTSGIPSIGAENIEKFGVYDFSKEKFVSEEFFDNMKRGKVQSGDVLLYKDGAYTGKVSMALDGFPHKKCALNEHVFLLRANDKCSQFFLYYCLSCDKNKTYLHNLACAKAALPGLNQQELLGMPIFIPEYDKIEKFTDIVNPLMHKIAQNALENIKLSAIRDALLPKFMSGEIDVENLPPSAIIPNE